MLDVEAWIPEGYGSITFKKGEVIAELSNGKYSIKEKFRSARYAREWLKEKRGAMFFEILYDPPTPIEYATIEFKV